MQLFLFVSFVLFGAVHLQAHDTIARQKRQSNDFAESFNFDDKGYEEDGPAIRYSNPSNKWARKPGGWKKPEKPCRRPPCPTPKPSTLPPNDDPITEPPSPTLPPTEPTIYTRPTFMTTAEPETKPTPKPPVPTKPPRPPTSHPGDGSVVFPDDSGEEWRPKPTRTPSPKPTPKPTPEPTPQPSPKPTPKTTPEPTPQPSPKPTPIPDVLEPSKSNDSTDAPITKPINKCMSKCYMTAEEEPVCGNNGVTYINQGHFQCAKKCGVAVSTISGGPCKGNDDSVIKQCLSQCPVSTEFNPVCGTNGQTYLNYGLLVCAKSCGVVVDFYSKGLCAGSTTETPPDTTTETNNPDSSTPLSDEKRQCIRNCPVTSEYNPVCGTNSFTYTNPRRLLCAKDCGVAVDLLSRGPCRSIPSSTTAPIIRNTTPSFLQKACLGQCPVTTEYNPVCGTDNVTYYNSVALYCAQYCGSQVKKLKSGECDKITNPPTITTEVPVEGDKESPTAATVTSVATPSPVATPSSVARECIRQCPATPEYNPVCGTDYETYNNPGRLYCAQNCGVDVKLLRHGPCPRRPTTIAPTTTTAMTTSSTPSDEEKKCISGCIATPEYNPVCGTNYETYSNLGRLYCAKYCGVEVKLLRHGPCPKRPAANAPSLDTPPTMRR